MAACPHCGSTSTKKIRPRRDKKESSAGDEPRIDEVTIVLNRECLKCHREFEPPIPAWVTPVLLMVGSLLILIAVSMGSAALLSTQEDKSSDLSGLFTFGAITGGLGARMLYTARKLLKGESVRKF